MHFVIAYDIQQNRRRTKVMNLLKDIGLGITTHRLHKIELLGEAGFGPAGVAGIRISFDSYLQS